ncbi:MAG: hypothetical protein HYY44_02270 [Deltaproteobacteria bacterium]|nr:hypothetical protein [Deltaproteobacteria bacterium]
MKRPIKSRRFFEDCGRQGGRRRARLLSPSKRSAIAKQAAAARWGRIPSSTPSKSMPSVRLDDPQFDDPVYLAELLEEGSLSHWREIYQRITDQPFGPTADALEKVLSSHKIYGVTPLWEGILREAQGFAEILKKVEEEAGWRTKRFEPPVLILGQFQGVRTGIRQLVRSAPLQTTVVRGLRIPTLEEMLRIKGYLIVRRNTTRDFIDFVALFDHLGAEKSVHALDSLDTLYPQEGEDSSISQQLAMQLAEPRPWDLSQMDLSHYKSLRAPYSDWEEIEHRANATGRQILLRRLGK